MDTRHSATVHLANSALGYGSTPDQVYEGYTPGYLGTEVADDGTVVYGTGYDYPPWIGSVWYGPPMTWGCGFADCWSPWWGWGFDCGFGWGCGFGGLGGWDCYPPLPWWGGFRHRHDHDGHEWGDGGHGHLTNTGADLYHRHGQFGGEGRREQFAGRGSDAPLIDGHRAGVGDFGRAYNSRTGPLTAGQQARVDTVSGSAWNPAYRPGPPAQDNALGVISRGGVLANGNGLIAGSRQPNSTYRAQTFPEPSQERSYGSFGPRVDGLNRGIQNYSVRGLSGGTGLSATPRSGGWFHSFGGFFHGGGSGFRGGGGGSVRGGGGGGGHGGDGRR